MASTEIRCLLCGEPIAAMTEARFSLEPIHFRCLAWETRHRATDARRRARANVARARALVAQSYARRQQARRA
jgi:hypothetical protein